MQWSAITGFVIFVLLTGSVKGILVFSFCAVVSFIFVRNLLNGDDQLDFTRYFTSKGHGLTEERDILSVKSKPFPLDLRTCRHALVRNILRDFVISWYENVGISGHFILETRSLLEEATVSFYDKIARTSVSHYTEKLCILLHKHLAAFQAVKVSLDKNHRECRNIVKMYRSLQKKSRTYHTNELQYLRNVIDLLLYKLVAPKTLGCDTGRFILREILAVKLLLPLVDTMSGPDFVNTSIINIFGESKDKNLLTSSLEFNEVPKSDKKGSTGLMEYLNQNLELDNTSDYNTKLVLPQQSTKHKFKDATVVEKDHRETGELSMEANEGNVLEINATSSVDRLEDNSGQLPAQKTSKTTKSYVSKKPKLTNKQGSHSSIINGLTKVKNEIFKPHKEKEHSSYSKSKTILNAIPATGVIFARNFRRIHTSPVIKSTTANFGESEQGEIISEVVCNAEESSDLSTTDDGRDTSSSRMGRSASFGCENAERRECDAKQLCSSSMPQIIPSAISTESTSSLSFEEGNIYEIDGTVEGVDCPDSFNIAKECETVKQGELETISSDDKSKPSQKNSTPTINRKQTTNISDSEAFEKSDDGLLFVVGDDFLSADEQGMPHKAQVDEDTVSKADFAIHDVPSPCLMISIPSTQLVTDHTFEPYKSRYTVYVIKYNTQLWEQPEYDHHPVTESSEAGTECSIKRRYREFMELHHRLVSGSFASLMKDIPKPNRKFNSPFFRLDQDVVEGRKQLLENYLKCLVNKPEILNCNDFKGFLGIGDESHTDFRRYVVPLPNVPRIDKKLQKKVTKIIDHIKTAFDTGPIDGDKEEEYEDIRQVLGEDKTSQDEIRTFAVCSGACKLNHSCCDSDNCFHTFIQHHRDETDSATEYPTPKFAQSKEALATRLNPDKTCAENGHTSNNVRVRKYAPNLSELKSSKDPTKRKQNGASTSFESDGFAARCSKETQGQETNNPLTKTVFNLSCQLLEKSQSWVCLKPVQQAATAVFGYFLEWWMEGLLSELVTEEQWQYYLRLLTDTVWPGGELMKSTEQMKTDTEKLKTKEEAIQTLSNFFGAVLHTAIGKDAIESSVREIVESLQNSEINRQLLFEALEVILAEVFPDLTNEKELYLSSRNC